MWTSNLKIFIVLLFFFFKQKTAYEMRISDWSSDVCSSDLRDGHPPWPAEAHDADRVVAQDGDQVAGKACDGELREADHAAVAGQHHKRQRDGAEDQRIAADLVGEEIGGEARQGEAKSDERRVGKERVSKCR